MPCIVVHYEKEGTIQGTGWLVTWCQIQMAYKKAMSLGHLSPPCEVMRDKAEKTNNLNYPNWY